MHVNLSIDTFLSFCPTLELFYAYSMYCELMLYLSLLHLYSPGSCSKTHSVCSQQRLCWTVAVYQLFIGPINLHSVGASLAVRHVYQYTLCFAGRKEIPIDNKSSCEGFCQRTVIDLWSLPSGTKQWRMPDVIRRAIWLFSVIVLKNKRVDRG